MIDINKKYTKELAETYSYGKPVFIMEAQDNVNYTGKIIYPIFNESNQKIDNITIDISKDSWNDFWTNFNDFSYLVQPLQAKDENVILSEDVETEVVNEPEPKPVVEEEVVEEPVEKPVEEPVEEPVG